MNAAAEKLSSIRHYCFARGVLGRGSDRDFGGDADFLQAFRTVNRLYVEARHGIALKAPRSVHRARQGDFRRQSMASGREAALLHPSAIVEERA